MTPLSLLTVLLTVGILALVEGAAPSPSPTARPTSSAPTPKPSRTPTVKPTANSPRVNYWRNDVIKLTLPDARGFLSSMTPTVLTLVAQTNGPVYDKDGGHFRLILQAQDVIGMSDCIRIGENMLKVQKHIAQMTLRSNSSFVDSSVLLSDVLDVKVQKLQSAKSTMDWTTSYKFSFQQTERGLGYFGSSIYKGRVTARLNTTDCAAPRTIGHWSDPIRWSRGVVPNSSYTAIFSKGVGVTILPPSPVTIYKLTMNDGLLLAYNSTCPTGWTPNPTGLVSSKCYKLFDEVELTFDEAESACQNSYGSMDAHLVQISDLAEQGLVRRLCRGAIGSSPYVRGCWIGLKDKAGVGKYNWLEPKTVRNNTFRDWRRYEWNNHTFSEGSSTNGELCVHHVPWQVDPLIVEQGSWNDISCSLKKSYVCQMFATTMRGSLTVTGDAILSGGGIEGGVLSLQGFATVTNFFARRTGTIQVWDKTMSTNIMSNVYLEDGSALSLAAIVRTTDTAYIGERVLAGSSSAMLPTVTMTSTAQWYTTQTTTINAETEISGSVRIGSGSQVQLLRGGLLSQATFVLDDQTCSIVLGGSSKMSTYDAFEIKLSHRAPVIGEYDNVYVNENAGIQKGVYRLKIGTEVSAKCIGYHASAEDVAQELNTMTVVKARGGVTVRRYGDGTDPSFSYGYTYRVEMDAPPTTAFALGGLNMTVSCYGIGSCGCAQTKVPLKDETGQQMCLRRQGNSSRVDPDACVVPPVIVVNRVSKLSYMKSTTTSGTGTLVISDGTHRLPPKSGITISSASIGTGMVGADSIDWGGIAVDGSGSIIVTGTGWLGWDSATSLWSPEWADYRGKVSLLERSPGFNMNVRLFSIAGLGRVLTASPNSNMTWVQGVWNGGIIGGRSRLIISKELVAGDANKALRYAITLYIQKNALFRWDHGNISLANGAQIIVDGNFTANTVGSVTQYMGMANLLSAPDKKGTSLLEVENPLNWHGYFGNELELELRGGTYQNPLCGQNCDRTPIMLIRSGIFTLVDGSKSSFALPVNLLGFTTKNIGVSAYVEMASGGICGNNVQVDIKTGTYYIFSGGQMAMRRYCKIKGQGELLITGGRHDLGSQIDSHITIAGGAMVWPKTNPAGDTIRFNGGLLISNTGSLQVEPFKTKIIIQKEVIFQDDSILQFPMIGSAAQASNSDSQDAPDTSPRGSLEAMGVMRWNGGTLRGKADFIASNILYIGGGLKQIRSLAKLVNKGHAEWSTGDILMADGGDFLNLGNVQMANGTVAFIASDLYQGAVTPIESGGDVFAKSFHSYDLDQGYLNYDQYVQLRTQFVSQAPPGWTAAQQSQKMDTPFNIV